MSDLDAETTRALARTIGASMFGLLGMYFLGSIFDDEPHVLTAAELRRALDAAPPLRADAYRVLNGWFNPELLSNQGADYAVAERARKLFRLTGEYDLGRWRRARPTRPESLARHHLDAESIQ